MNSFGLGIVLDFQDNASMNIMNVVQNFNILSETVDKTQARLGDSQTSSLLAMNQIGRQMQYAGSAMEGWGKNILGGFVDVGKKVKDVSGDFELFGVTLKALYGSEAEAQKQINNLFDFAVDTPFEVSDVKDMLVVLKSQGIEAFDAISASSGQTQKALSWLGDLMAFKPDVATSRWILAFQNYIGSGEFKVLRNILDMGKIEDILGHKASDTIEGRMQDIADIVASKNLTGLMSNQMDTLKGKMSNFEDQITRIYYAIGNAGVFDILKESFINLSEAFSEIPQEKLNQFGKVVADAFNMLFAPIHKLSEVLGELIPKLIDFSIAHPTLTKFVLGLVAFTGVGLVASGIFLKLTGGLIAFMANISIIGGVPVILSNLGKAFGFLFSPITKTFSILGRFGTLIGDLLVKIPVAGKVFSGLGKVFSLVRVGAMSVLGPIAAIIAALGLLYLAYKTNFLGLQDTLEPIFETLRIVGSFLFNGGALSIEDWEKADKMGIRPFLESLAQLGAIFMDYIIPAIKAAIPIIIQTLSSFIMWIGTAIETVVSVIRGALDIIIGLIKTVVGIITGDFSLAAEGIKQVLGGAFNVVAGIIQGVINTVIDLWNWLHKLFDKNWESVAHVNLVSTVSGVATGTKVQSGTAVDSKYKTTNNRATGVGATALPTANTGVFGLAQKLLSNKETTTGRATGGVTKDTGLANLHPNEFVVNETLTSRLDKFLTKERVSGVVTPTRTYNNTNYPVNNDYSVTFSQGSIVFNVEGGNLTDAQLEKYAVKLMATIERKQQLKKMATRR